MPRPRTYIDEAGNVCNGQDVQDAYDNNEESKSEEEREDFFFTLEDDDNYPYEIEKP